MQTTTRCVLAVFLVALGCSPLTAAGPVAAAESPEARFAAMSADEVRAYEFDLMRRIADLALVPPKLNTAPLPQYDYDRLDYGMTIGIERTPKGRLWACWVAGGDSPKAFFVLATSDDDGETWSKPRLVVDAHSKSLPMDRSVLVGNLWTDPRGRLWLIFDQSMDMFDGRAGVWMAVCENPDADRPAWSPPRRIWHGVTLNKPTVLANGEWLLLVKHGDAVNSHQARVKLSAWLSDDDGRTWRGGLVLDERKGVSYPDGFQSPDGTIYISYDRNRAADGEILLARFTEEDVLAQKLVGPRSKLKILISRPLGMKKA